MNVYNKIKHNKILKNFQNTEPESESEMYLFDPHTKFIQSNNDTI